MTKGFAVCIESNTGGEWAPLRVLGLPLVFNSINEAREHRSRLIEFGVQEESLRTTVCRFPYELCVEVKT